MFELSTCSSYICASYRCVRIIDVFELSLCSFDLRIRVIDMFGFSMCSSYRCVRVIDMFKLSMCLYDRRVLVIDVFDIYSQNSYVSSALFSFILKCAL